MERNFTPISSHNWPMVKVPQSESSGTSQPTSPLAQALTTKKAVPSLGTKQWSLSVENSIYFVYCYPQSLKQCCVISIWLIFGEWMKGGREAHLQCTYSQYSREHSIWSRKDRYIAGGLNPNQSLSINHSWYLTHFKG